MNKDQESRDKREEMEKYLKDEKGDYEEKEAKYKKGRDKEVTKKGYKGPPTFSIHLKSTQELRKTKLNIPCVKIPPSVSVVPILQHASCELATLTIPKLNPESQTTMDVRVPNLEPLVLNPLTASLPRLRVGSTSDISVRPLIYEKLAESKKVGQLQIKAHPHTPIQIPLNTTQMTKVQTLQVPAIHLGELSVTTETHPETQEPKSDGMVPDFDFIEFLLGGGSASIFSGKPLCLLVEKHKRKSEYLIATVCREIYREIKGGYPQPIPMNSVKDWELKYRTEISNQIVVIRDAEYSEELEKALSKFPMSDIGFLILVCDNIEELEEEIGRNIPTVRDYITRIEPLQLSKGVEDKIIKFVSGSQLLKHSFGEDFMNAAKRFDELLKEKYLVYSKAPEELRLNWRRVFAKSPESSDAASKEHSAMKAFTWIYAKRRHEHIPTLEDSRGVDVSIRDENYEIESFYGCEEPIAKLMEKVEKFSKGEKVFFVLRNISIIMHFRDLAIFRNTMRKRGYDVEIFGIDFEKEKLIPLNEFVQTLKEQS